MEKGNKDYYNGQFSNYDGSDVNELIEHQKDFAVIEDNKVSDKTTYSSTKIEDLISGATSGTCIDDNNVSEETTYSSSKLEEIFGKVVILTQEEYDSLEVKDEQTFYIISDAS